MTETTGTTQHITLRCEFCQTWNRVDASRAADRPKCGKCARPMLLDRPIALNDDTFQRTIAESTVPVLVDFYADWCAPCKMMAPAVDNLTLEFELPGLDPEQVEVTAENGVLTVRGEKRAERKEGDERRYHLVERTYGAFSRSFQLPAGVDEGQIDAQFENGVLHVRIPKAALPQPRRIEVQRGRGGDGSTQGRVKGGTSQRAMGEAGEGQRTMGDGQRGPASSGTTASGETSKKREPATAGR